METGLFNIYRIKPDASGKERITEAKRLSATKRKDGLTAFMGRR